MTDWTVEYKAKVRSFIATKGVPVEFDKRYAWQEDDEVSIYGWQDFDAASHCREYGDGCHWIVPEGAELSERTYRQFEDTDAGNRQEMGVNVKGCRCACGRYTDVTLRWIGSVAEMLREVLGPPTTPTVTL